MLAAALRRLLSLHGFYGEDSDGSVVLVLVELLDVREVLDIAFAVVVISSTLR